MNKKNVIISIVLLLGISLIVLLKNNAKNEELSEEQAFDTVEVSQINEIEESTDLIEIDDTNTSTEKSTDNSSTDSNSNELIIIEDNVETDNNVENIIPQNIETKNNEGNTIKDKEVTSNNKVSNDTKNLKENTIYFLDKEIPYKNGGQEKGHEIIQDKKTASTWGGVAIFNGSDNKNTHFIGGHNYQFKDIQDAKEFIITDENKKAFKYIVRNVFTVDKYGVGLEDGKDYWEKIIGESGGEKVTLQTDINKYGDKVILEAYLVR